MKKIILVLATSLVSLWSIAQTIPKYFYGQNAWMPDSNGIGINRVGFGGKLLSNWGNVAQSNVKIVRFGGNFVDRNIPANSDYLRVIDSLQSRGIEPAVTVPYFNGTYDTTDAKNILTYINVTKTRKVKYWIIGNEPDLYAAGKKISAATISNYIKNYSVAMKRIDSSIKIIGPEFSYYTSDPFDTLHKKMDTLTTHNGTYSIVDLIPNTGTYGKAAGKAYVDFLSYHMYYFYGGTNGVGDNRDTIINHPVNHDSSAMGYLQRRAASIAGRGSYPLNVILTEANLCTQGSATVAPTDDTLGGVKCSGFLAGQVWTEILAQAAKKQISWINFWSSMEGNGGGYMTNSTTPTKKHTYYHIQEMAKYFTTGSTIYLGTTSSKHLKGFAAKTSAYIAVLLLNEDTRGTAPLAYTIKLNGTHSTTNWVDFATGVSVTYTDTMKASSSTLILFDCGGNASAKYRYEITDINNPWKSVWAAASPATVLTANLDADRYSCCNTPLTCTPSISGATYDFRWAANNYSVTIQTANTSTNSAANEYANAPPQTYSVIVTKGGCTATDSTKLFGRVPSCCRVAGIDPHTFTSVSELISSVPNPNNGRTTIYFTLAEGTQKAEVTITDLFGKVIQRIPIKPGEGSIDVDVSDLPEGIYLYSLLEGNRTVGTKKMMISK